MGVTHIPIAEARRDIDSVFALVRNGEQVSVDDGSESFVIQPAHKDRSVEASLRRALEYESRFPEPPVMDEEFARDMEEIIALRRPRRIEYDPEIDG